MTDRVGVNLEKPKKVFDKRRGKQVWKCRSWRLRWRDRNGAEHYQSLPGWCKTRTEAESYRRDKEADLNAGRAPLEPQAVTISQAASGWNLDRKGNGVSHSTIKNRRAGFRFLVDVLGGSVGEPDPEQPLFTEVDCGFKVAKVRPSHIAQVRDLLARSVKPNSQVAYLQAISSYFNRAIRLGWMQENPVRAEGTGTQEPGRVRPFSAVEVGKMLAVLESGDIFQKPAKADWWRAYILTEWATGLRPTACLHLRWVNACLDRVGDDLPSLTVKEVRSGDLFDGIHPLIPFGVGCGAKNSSIFDRTWPLPEFVADTLKTWRTTQSDGSPYLFLSAAKVARIGGRPRHTLISGVREDFDRIQEAAAEGGPWQRATVHNFRDTLSKILADAKIDPSTIDFYLGHKAASVRAQHYHSPNAGQVVEALERWADRAELGTCRGRGLRIVG